MLTLSDEERTVLNRWTRQRTSTQALAQRCRIILECANGKNDKQVSEHVGVTPQTVGKWRRRFMSHRLQGLLDEPRTGTRHRLTNQQVERVLKLTRNSPPPDAETWTTRSMAEASGLSRSSVNRIWRAFALAPQRSGTVTRRKDPSFVDKVRDIVGLYLDPPDRVLALCVDDLARPGFRTHEEANPVEELAMDTASDAQANQASMISRLEAKVAPLNEGPRGPHRSQDLRKFLNRIDSNVPSHLAVHLILDHYATPVVHRWLIRRPRFHLHFTPPGTSWITIVELWFSLLTENQERRGLGRSTRQLERVIQGYVETHANRGEAFAWWKKRADISTSP